MRELYYLVLDVFGISSNANMRMDDIENHNGTGNASHSLSSHLNGAGDCIFFRFMFYTIIIGSLNILGILGNILSIAVLQRDQHNRVTAFLLQSLAAADSFVLIMSFLVLSVIYGLLPYMDKSDWASVAIPYIIKYIHPLGYMCQSGTIWITVLLAINRYIAIVKPFLTVKLCTINKARIQVLTVIILSIAFNIPRFFQYNIIQLANPPGSNNTVIGISATVIGEQSIFGVIYTNIIYTILVLLVPLVILVYFNTCLIREIKFPSKKSLSVGKKSRSFQKLKRQPSFSSPPLPEEDNITFIMVIIIVMFLCCHTPDRIVQIIRYFFSESHHLHCGQTLYYVSSVCNLLIVLNSSSNFIIYYLLRKRFRKILMMKVCAWSSLKRYKEKPSFLEHHDPPPLLRRKTDGDMEQKINGIRKMDATQLQTLQKTGSAPSLF